MNDFINKHFNWIFPLLLFSMVLSLVGLCIFGISKCSDAVYDRNKTIEAERYERYKSETKSSFANPEIVGQLEDGRVVKRIKVQDKNHIHYIYVAGKDTTVNFNAGKTSPENVNTLLE